MSQKKSERLWWCLENKIGSKALLTILSEYISYVEESILEEEEGEEEEEEEGKENQRASKG